MNKAPTFHWRLRRRQNFLPPPPTRFGGEGQPLKRRPMVMEAPFGSPPPIYAPARTPFISKLCSIFVLSSQTSEAILSKRPLTKFIALFVALDSSFTSFLVTNIQSAFLPALAYASLAPDGKFKCVPCFPAISSFLTFFGCIKGFVDRLTCTFDIPLLLSPVNRDILGGVPRGPIAKKDDKIRIKLQSFWKIVVTNVIISEYEGK